MQNTIYIGAPLEGVNRYQIFRERPKELIARLAVAYSMIDLLFVSVDYLSAAQAELTQQGSARNLAYLQSLEKRPIPAQVPVPAVKVAADTIVNNVIKKAGGK